MGLKESKEQITMVLDKAAVEEIDALAAAAKMSRSAFLAGVIDIGMKQHRMTRKYLANRYVAKALQLIFGDRVEKLSKNPDSYRPMEDPAVEAIRNKILSEIKELSVMQAEKEIARDIGLTGEGESASGGGKRKDRPAHA